MLKIAITGGIGSGKSTVSGIIRDLGGIVLSCDDINRDMLADSGYIAKLSSIFPYAVRGGQVDKKSIRECIAKDKDKRAELDSLAHREIRSRIIKAMDMYQCKGERVVFCEVPLLYECGMQSDYDRVWVVVSDIEDKIDRVMARDGVSAESVQGMFDCQMTDSDRTKEECEIIENNGSIQDLRLKVVKKYDSLLKNI